MKLNYSSIYESNTSVKVYPNVDLTGMQSRFLELGQRILESYNLTDVSIAIEDVSTGGLFKSKSAAALTLNAQFKPYTFMGVVTISTFGALCVIGSYKSLDGQGLFESSKSAQEKKLVLLQKLSNLVSTDYFYALEASIDFVATSIGGAIDEAYGTYQSQLSGENGHTSP